MKLFVFACALGAALSASVSAQPPLSATNVVIFSAQQASGKALSGSCWTSSIASGRFDAYRCMVTNAIYDPCFAIGTQYVQCPELAAPRGVLIRLTKKLPVAHNSGTSTPYMMLLQGNVRCNVGTGTVVLGHPFYCSNSLVCSAPVVPYTAFRSNADAERLQIPLTTVDCGKSKNGRDVYSRRALAVATIWV